MSYKDINNYFKANRSVNPIYNSTYVVNYGIVGSAWISFDGVDVVRIKVSYAKEKALVRYVVWEVSYDDHWVLSQAGMGIFLSHKMAYELWKDGKGMEIMDPSLDDTLSSCKSIKCLQIALLCVQENPIDTPSMLEVSSMLKNETTIVTIPKRPAFSVKTDEDD
ncbi:hypothetical protein Peur_031144 [Populus x canadensis]